MSTKRRNKLFMVVQLTEKGLWDQTRRSAVVSASSEKRAEVIAREMAGFENPGAVTISLTDERVILEGYIDATHSHHDLM